MPWWKLERDNFKLRTYYLGFAATWPPGLVIMLGVLRILFAVSVASLLLLWALLSMLMVLGGAPLLYWAHKTSLRTGSPRPLILAVELMILGGVTPFFYFLVKQNGFDPVPLIGTSLVFVVPLLLLYWFPPKLLADRIQAGLKKIVESGPSA